MVEAMANSVEDVLVDGLSFKLKPGTSYINERKSVTFHPQGSNIYSTNGTKLIKILVTGGSWMDPSTFRIQYDLLNNDANQAHELRPLGDPGSFFRRMRVLCNGQIVEDIDNYNRVEAMFSCLSSSDSVTNIDAEGFGQRWNREADYNVPYNADTYRGIYGGQSQTVLFKPLSGLLNQSKYLPIRYAPLTIELEIVSNSNDPIISDLTGTVFTGENTSVAWQIQNVQVKVDLCTLDNALDNSYAEHLLSGKALPINYNTFVSQMQSILSGANGQQKVRLNVTRALSRLKSVFVTLFKSMPAVEKGTKEWNTFYSPMMPYAGFAANQYNSLGEFEAQLQLGAKLYPEYPIRSHAEGFYQLRKTLGVKSSTMHNFDIDSHEYRSTKFIWATDMERVLESSFSGINTRAGDILNIRFDHNDGTAANYATSMHIILHSDQVLEIRDGGVTVFD